MYKKLLDDYNIDKKRLNQYFPLFRHFEIIEHENITPLENGAYHVRAKYYGVNGQKKSLPNLVVNKLIHNELSFNYNRTPVYSRYDYSSGSNSKSKHNYFQVIPIGTFKLFQSDIVKDIGDDLFIKLSSDVKIKISKCNSIDELDYEILSLIDKYVSSYKTENHKYNTNEVLLDCESYLLLPI
jgi:hypothetical protein